MRFPDLHTGILIAYRTRYLSTSLWLLLAVVGVALMASQFSGRQPATVAIDVGLSALRLLLPIMIVLLVQELFSREFERRYFLTSITYPRPRYKLLLERLLTVLLLIYGLLLVMALVLAFVASQIASGYAQATPVDLGAAYWITMGFIATDLFVLVTVATLLSIAAPTPGFVLIGTLGFMLIARSYSGIIALLERHSSVVDNPELYKNSLSLFYYILPDLGSLDVRMISLYGSLEMLPDGWGIALATSLVYALFLLTMALILLNRKSFS